LQDLESLDLSFCAKIRDIDPLATLTRLRVLDLSACTEIRDLGPLQALKQLRSLSLTGEVFFDFLESRRRGPLTTLQVSLKARGIDLAASIQGPTTIAILRYQQSVPMFIFEPIAHVIGLEFFDLKGWSHVETLPSLKSLGRLQSLNLFGWQGLSDLLPLMPLTNLQTLNLGNCKGITDFSPLMALTSLRTLSIVGVDEAADLDPLNELGLLENIVVGRTLFDRLPPILLSSR
jgi:internalin A